MLLVFCRNKPSRPMIFSTSPGLAAGKRLGARPAREQDRRDLVHRDVGALRAEHRRDDQLERIP